MKSASQPPSADAQLRTRSSPAPCRGAPARFRARLPAGGARDRRDAAVADRPRDRLDDRRRCSASRSAVGLLRHGRSSSPPPRARSSRAAAARSSSRFETGVVRAIHVRDGQNVKAGDVLIELDPTMNDAERDHLQSDLVAAELDVARLRGRARRERRSAGRFRAAAGRQPAHGRRCSRATWSSQIAEQQLKIAELDAAAGGEGGRARRSRRRRSTRSRRQSRCSKQRVDMRKYLFDKALGSKLTYLHDTRTSSTRQQELTVQQKQADAEADAAIGAIERDRAAGRGRVSPQRSTTDLAKAEREGRRAAPGRDQGRAADQAAAAHRAGRRRRAAARGPHRRRRGDAGAAAARRRAGRQPPRDRGDGVEPRHRLRPAPARRPRSRSTPSISPATACSTARC